MESLGVASDIIKSLVRIIVVLIVLEFATIAGFLIYLSLPVDIEGEVITVEQIEDDEGSVSYIGGDYNGVPESNNKEI